MMIKLDCIPAALGACLLALAAFANGAIAQTTSGAGSAPNSINSAATRAALDAAPELLFIVADDADWPKELYGRIGYAPIGTKSVYTRHAPGFAWGAPLS